MRTIIRKWGNSMALRIPKSVIRENNIHEGTQMEISSKNGKIILEAKEEKVREGWEEAARETHKNKDDRFMMNFSNDFDEEEWTW